MNPRIPPARMSLSELNSLLREVIELGMPGSYWVEAELSEVRTSRGHCYMDLVEKEAYSRTPIARAQARCWRQTWAVVQPRFERATGQRLQPGLKVLLRVSANFHEAFGFAWIVEDIDPTYTLGDLARRRMEILAKLKADGVIDLNKQLPMPIIARRIAVVSSATAAGYGDFCHQLNANAQGYRFSVTLFEATMQGEQVEASIIAALNAINARAHEFDCVVIIRGGGATSDLSGFDTLALAENVANFPLPIITGIGHERDMTVLDMVAHTCVKTPTAAAAMLIDRMRTAEEQVEQLARRLTNAVAQRLFAERQRLAAMAQRLPAAALLAHTRQQARANMLSGRLAAAMARRIDSATHRLQSLESRLPTAAQRQITAQQHRLELLEQRAKALDPQLLLKRGYSITTMGAHAVTSASQLAQGSEIVTTFYQGKVKSTVTWTTTETPQ